MDRPWDENIGSLELHGFGDASEKGYGACVYLRTPNAMGSFKTSLIIAKGRVDPLKRVTLPRLELLGALICARLVKFVKEPLGLNNDTLCTYWIDSMVALAWIKGDAMRWKTFVYNRVQEIQSLSSPSSWKHCSGIDNPADV